MEHKEAPEALEAILPVQAAPRHTEALAETVQRLLRVQTEQITVKAEEQDTAEAVEAAPEVRTAGELKVLQFITHTSLNDPPVTVEMVLLAEMALTAA